MLFSLLIPGPQEKRERKKLSHKVFIAQSFGLCPGNMRRGFTDGVTGPIAQRQLSQELDKMLLHSGYRG